MAPWLMWILIAGFWFILEIVTVGFLVFWMGIGALLACLVSLIFPGSLTFQIIVWAVSSSILMICTRPIINKYLKTKNTPTNVYTILGKTAIVTEDINNILGKGQIKIDSDVWSARSEDGSFIQKGCPVEILRIDGVKVIVKSLLLINENEKNEEEKVCQE